MDEFAVRSELTAACHSTVTSIVTVYDMTVVKFGDLGQVGLRDVQDVPAWNTEIIAIAVSDGLLPMELCPGSDVDVSDYLADRVRHEI